MEHRSENELPLSRAQVHKLRILLETFTDQSTFEIPRDGLAKLIEMAEHCRTTSCHRCGVEVRYEKDHHIDSASGFVYCSAECWSRFHTENEPNEPKFVDFRPGHFEGHCEINTDVLQNLAINPKPINPKE